LESDSQPKWKVVPKGSKETLATKSNKDKKKREKGKNSPFIAKPSSL